MQVCKDPFLYVNTPIDPSVQLILLIYSISTVIPANMLCLPILSTHPLNPSPFQPILSTHPIFYVVGSRIGAFEVQIAYRNSKNELQLDLLHSKLVTRRWPSKTVLEKRIRAFVSQCSIPTFSTFDGSYGDGYGSDGLGSYPIGNAAWEGITSLSPPETSYLHNPIYQYTRHAL